MFMSVVESAFPVVYALMSKKTQALYAALFQRIKKSAPVIMPSSAMADFEEASVSVFRTAFDNVNISGCWFLFAQAIVKRANKIGLKDA
jgi:hypothetical protein